MKLLFLTVMPSPYQRELFATLDAEADLEIEVLYFTAMSSDRDWQNPRLNDFEEVMEGWTLQFIGSSAHWNPSVVSKIKASDADLVIISDYSAPTAQVAMRFLERENRPFVFWGEVPGFSKRGMIGNWIRAQLQAPLKNASGFAAIGEKAVEKYSELFPGKPIFNIPYFCDLARFVDARSANSLDKEVEVEVLFSGQLIDRKGVDVLLAAFARVATCNPKLRLRLLGSGPERARYLSLVPEHLSGRVDFMGHVEPVELPALFARASIFCLPSRHDGWGVVVNEALGAGLPMIVSSSVGAGRDLVRDGCNGFITPTEDVDALADAISRLAGDRALRAKMAEQSRTLAKSWGLDEGAKRWKSAASTVLRASQSWKVA